VPGVNRALSIESKEALEREGLLEALRRRVALSGGKTLLSSSGSRRVGVKESPNAVPQEGQELLSSGISL
jgi:hypothetical protein